MGKKIPYDTARIIGGLKKNESIYNLDKDGYPCPNRWGYRYNVNHPDIRPLYEAYHKHIDVPLQIHMTTAQRLKFEAVLDKMVEKKRRESGV